MITQAELKSLMSYDPETGVFTRLPGTDGRGRKSGGSVGSAHISGYQSAMVQGKNYMLHRLAWLYMTGAFPPADIDHRDGNRRSNVWTNLRAADRAENNQNMSVRKDNSSGVPGVCRVGDRWRVRVTVRGTHHHVGYFADLTAAKDAQAVAKARYHTFQPVARASV